MYAIMVTGGKQYKVSEGDEIKVEKLDVEPGKEVTFDNVIAVSDDNTLKVAGDVSSAKVSATVVEQGRAKKVVVAMQHTNKGAHKLFEEISLPATALRAVDMIVTELGVLEITDKGFTLRELAPGVSIEDMQAATGAPIVIDGEIKEMCMPPEA